jgi:cytochrome c553
MRSLLKVLTAIVVSVATSVTASAAGNPEHGAVLADTCLGCHGIPGYRNAYPSYRVPKLGGQHQDYLVLALQGYKSAVRSHPTMQAQSASLSDADMRDLAAYFASQGDARQGLGKTNGKIARGKEKTAVCAACHGETGVSPTPNWPTLAGQHEDYLQQSIVQYQNGERNDPVMMGQVLSLSARDVEDIAAFYAAQKGLFTAGYSD